MQCRNTASMNVEFILESFEDMKTFQVVGLSDEELRSFEEDIKKYLREDTKDLLTKQKAIRMNHLFRAFSIKAWSITDFSGNT